MPDTGKDMKLGKTNRLGIWIIAAEDRQGQSVHFPQSSSLVPFAIRPQNFGQENLNLNQKFRRSGPHQPGQGLWGVPPDRRGLRGGGEEQEKVLRGSQLDMVAVRRGKPTWDDYPLIRVTTDGHRGSPLQPPERTVEDLGAGSGG